MGSVGFVYRPDYEKHDTGWHPERSSRVEAIAESVRDAATPGVQFVDPSPATIEQVTRVHSLRHVQYIERFAASGGGYIGMDTVVSPASYDVAMLAAGGAIKAVEVVLRGELGAAFAAVRPPGHHAGPDEAAGFCLFNNVAIAAREAQVAFGVSRVLIVDFDVHHGNGTQQIFLADPSVLYASIHQHPLYPGTGAHWEVGRGPGVGYTVNVPVPPGTGDAEYRRIFDEVFDPIVRRFRPDLMLVSAGYDAHWADALAHQEVTTAGFGWMVRRLKGWADELCGGKLALVLEGGYDLDALTASIVASLEALSGAQATDVVGPPQLRRPVTAAGAVAIGPIVDQVRRALPIWFG